MHSDVAHLCASKPAFVLEQESELVARWSFDGLDVKATSLKNKDKRQLSDFKSVENHLDASEALQIVRKKEIKRKS